MSRSEFASLEGDGAVIGDDDAVELVSVTTRQGKPAARESVVCVSMVEANGFARDASVADMNMTRNETRFEQGKGSSLASQESFALSAHRPSEIRRIQQGARLRGYVYANVVSTMCSPRTLVFQSTAAKQPDEELALACTAGFPDCTWVLS